MVVSKVFFYFLSFFVSVILLLSSCSATKIGQAVLLQKVSFSNLQNFNTEHEQLDAFLKSCKMLDGKARFVEGKKSFGQVRDWVVVCRKALLYKQEKRSPTEFFQNNFTPYLITGNSSSEGLFTGYYQPLLKGSRTKTSEFQYPVYSLPQDPAELQKIKQATREQIDKGILSGKSLEILYVNDPVKLFFLHVQGSGIIKLPDGSKTYLGFSGKNDYEYTSIGAYLKESGELKGEISADEIKSFLYKNPVKAQEIMWQNRSYVFFQELPVAEAIGAQGVALTPGVSLAVDNSYIPYGVPLWVETTLPPEELQYRQVESQSFHTLMVTQDTGSAIKGVVRGDIFFGTGARAEYLASRMQSTGSYYVLLPGVD